jgi:hypothetical protein
MELVLPWMIGPVLLTLAMPRQYFARYLGWLALFVVVLGFLLFAFPGSPSGGPGEALGLIILIGVSIATATAVAAKLVYYAARGLPLSAEPDGTRIAITVVPPSTRGLFVCAGAVTGLVLLRVFIAAFQGVGQTWAAHLVLVGAVAGLLALRKSAQRRDAERDSLDIGLRDGLAGLAAMLAFAAIGSIAYPWHVKAAADAVAGDTPYCVQVAARASRPDYRPARALLDLSALTMHARRHSGMYMEHHAILAVGDSRSPRLFHWSHRKREFVPGVLGENDPLRKPTIYCDVARHYLGGLPLIFP